MYFDFAAATPMDPRVFESMKPWLVEKYANPSSIYQTGQEARAAIDDARMKIAEFLHAKPTEVYFTSSGTESCNWALKGIVEKRLTKGSKTHIIVSSIEHSSVLEMAKFLEQFDLIEVSYLPVDQEGIMDVEELKRALRPETVLVSVMMVNNEIGTVQPIQAIGNICKDRGIYFHTDACQASGYLDLNVSKLRVDLLTMNAGKIYGPKGVGILYVRDGVEIAPWTLGGGQEFRMRAGTENVAGIVGFGKAVEIAREHRQADADRIAHLRDTLWRLLQEQVPNVRLNGSLAQRISNNLNILIEGVDGETIVKKLDLMGMAVSTGSACASGTVEPSHVLLAIGLTPHEAKSSIRITLGRTSTEVEIVALARALGEITADLKKPL